MSTRDESADAFYRLLALVLFVTGLRFGEATALRVRDLELGGTRRTLTVVRAWKRQPDGTYSIGEPGTRRGRRTLPLPPKVAALLRTQLKKAARRTRWCSRAPGPPPAGGLHAAWPEEGWFVGVLDGGAPRLRDDWERVGAGWSDHGWTAFN